jgi:hypothetical protein
VLQPNINFASLKEQALFYDDIPDDDPIDYCDRVKISRSDGCRPLELSSGCDCIIEEDGESSRHDHSRE